MEENTQGRAGYHRCRLPYCASTQHVWSERSPWGQHLRRELLAAAKEGRVQDAENTVQNMVSRGVQPGPLAYHGLICAYCKAQDSKGALAVAQRAAQEGEARHAWSLYSATRVGYTRSQVCGVCL